MAKSLGETRENRIEKAREGKINTSKKKGDEDKKGNNKKMKVNRSERERTGTNVKA